MSEVHHRKFRVSVCRMVFSEVEITAANALDAETVARDIPIAKITFETGPIVHRIEQSNPVPGQPGEYQWEEVRIRG